MPEFLTNSIFVPVAACSNTWYVTPSLSTVERLSCLRPWWGTPRATPARPANRAIRPKSFILPTGLEPTNLTFGEGEVCRVRYIKFTEQSEGWMTLGRGIVSPFIGFTPESAGPEGLPSRWHFQCHDRDLHEPVRTATWSTNNIENRNILDRSWKVDMYVMISTSLYGKVPKMAS